MKGTTALDGGAATAYDIRVLKDWGQKRILDRSGNPTGQRAGATFFWAETDRPFFRLISQGVPAPSAEERLAINIFLAVYDFAREEYVEHGFQRGAGSSKTGPAPTDVPTTQISQGSFILNPDSPTPAALGDPKA